MEADWSVEVGGQLPVIDAAWAGLVDLRQDPAAVDEIAEAAEFPAMREALLTLHGEASPVYTVKCDVWPLPAEEIDPLEFGCGPEDAQAGEACYIDVLAREAPIFASFDRHEAWAQAAVLRLREIAVGHGRVDVVVRGAHSADAEGFGISLYVAGCGPDTAAAKDAWAAVLLAAVTATINEAEILPLV